MILLRSQKRVAAEIVNDLMKNIANVLLLPASVSVSEVEYIVGEELSTHPYLNSESLALMDCEEESPVRTLSEVFGVVWKDNYAPRTVGNLIRHGGLPEVVFLRGFADAPEERRRRWIECILEITELRIDDRFDTPTFCVVAQARDPMLQGLKPKLGFRVRYWYRLCSHAEAETYYQRMEGRSRPGEQVWRSAVLASLAGADSSLAEELGEAVVGNTSDIYGRVQRVGEQTGWSRGDLISTGIQPFVDQQWFAPLESLDDTHPIRNLWSLGLIDYSSEYGWEVPVWVLTILDEKGIFEHRVWRAQLKVVLPVINQLRLLVINALMRNYGTEWMSWPLPNQEEQGGRKCEGPLDAEPAFLRSLLFHHAQKLKEEQIFESALVVAHSLRNRLAHYATVEYAEYTDLLEKVDRLGSWR